MDARGQDADRILLAHVEDLARRGAYRSFTAFLDMRQYTLVRSVLREGTYRFFGGYPEAQRGILCVFPQDCEPADAEYPITCLTFTHPAQFTLSHRDVLGSLMAQQVQRDTVGDILVTPGKIQCFVTGAAASVGIGLTRIGRVGVKVTDALPYAGDFVQEVRECTGTVSTPRLDAVVRCAVSLGRGACLELIRAGAVSLNFLECLAPDKQVQAGDVFSVRGHGKFRVREITGPTKKGRLHIVIEQFL